MNINQFGSKYNNPQAKDPVPDLVKNLVPSSTLDKPHALREQNIQKYHARISVAESLNTNHIPNQGKRVIHLIQQYPDRAGDLKQRHRD